MGSQQAERMGKNDETETQDDKQGRSSGLGQPEQFDILSFLIKGLGNHHHLIHIINSPSDTGWKRAVLLFSGTMAIVGRLTSRQEGGKKKIR